MAYRVYHKNKKTGVVYVCEATAVWDKTEKQARNKQVCIGKIDPKTGEFIPSKRLDPVQAAIRYPKITAKAEIIGPSLILNKITKEIKLDKTLKSCFPDIHQQILCLAYYLVLRGNPLSHCKNWSASYENPYGKELASQRISEILASIDTDKQSRFFRKWNEIMDENDYICYDITSVSSYSQMNEYVRYGYNRDGENLKQINLAVLFGQNNFLPMFYRRLPGSINDVSTLNNTIKTFHCLNISKILLIMDKGFFSKLNLDNLLIDRHKFIIAVPNHLKLVQNAIDENRETMQYPDNLKIESEDSVFYAATLLKYWGTERRRYYIHIYYTPTKAAEYENNFMISILKYKEELESNCLIEGHEEAYRKFFIVKETPVRGRKVIYNNEEIDKFRNKYAGYYVLISNEIKDPIKARSIYINKDVIEKCFDDLKNQLDLKRLRVHNSKTMDGRLFIQFISLIYISVLREKIKSIKGLEKYNVRELLMEMESITKIKYTGKYGSILTELTKNQKYILESLEIKL